jgi:hypothetical protein
MGDQNIEFNFNKTWFDNFVEKFHSKVRISKRNYLWVPLLISKNLS